MLVVLMLSACTPTGGPTPPITPLASATNPPLPSATFTDTAVPTLTASPTLAPAPSETPTFTAVPTVDSLKATVTADLLSCRYGPGPNYLFLYGLRKGANIVLIGRTDEDNWHWVYVQGRNKCWVNTNYLQIEGEWKSLPIVYPGIAKLPISPYYPATAVLSAVRQSSQVTVEWLDVPLRAGDEEDERMQHYIVEVWRCENGSLLFEPLATNELSVTFSDEPGCSVASHGRIFVQEKHGFAGPAEIPWPPFQ
jgi:uncharacterized protein YraI